jgi:hypothetical protein
MRFEVLMAVKMSMLVSMTYFRDTSSARFVIVALHVQQYEEEMCFKRDAATNEEQGE